MPEPQGARIPAPRVHPPHAAKAMSNQQMIPDGLLGSSIFDIDCPIPGRTLLANSPDWLKATPMRENLLASWRQSGQKQDHCPSLLNHNAKYKRLLPPYCDFANGVRTFVQQSSGKSVNKGLPCA